MLSGAAFRRDIRSSMSETFSEHQLLRRIWLFGHSPPSRWSHNLEGVLDPRHPTRHSIWTSVADYLQGKVFDDGPRLRLDACKLLFRNAFGSADDVLPKLDFARPAVEEQRVLLSQQIQQYRPPVILTFGDEAYRFVSFASVSGQLVPRRRLKIENLGKTFRDVVGKFPPQQVNVFPLLHASVARASWATVGEKFSGPVGEKTISSMWDTSSEICC